MTLFRDLVPLVVSLRIIGCREQWPMSSGDDDVLAQMAYTCVTYNDNSNDNNNNNNNSNNLSNDTHTFATCMSKMRGLKISWTQPSSWAITRMIFRRVRWTSKDRESNNIDSFRCKSQRDNDESRAIERERPNKNHTFGNKKRIRSKIVWLKTLRT